MSNINSGLRNDQVRQMFRDSNGHIWLVSVKDNDASGHFNDTLSNLIIDILNPISFQIMPLTSYLNQSKVQIEESSIMNIRSVDGIIWIKTKKNKSYRFKDNLEV